MELDLLAPRRRPEDTVLVPCGGGFQLRRAPAYPKIPVFSDADPYASCTGYASSGVKFAVPRERATTNPSSVNDARPARSGFERNVGPSAANALATSAASEKTKILPFVDLRI